MGLSALMADSLEIIAPYPVKKFIGINPMGLSKPWDNSLYINALNPVKSTY